MIAGQRVVFLLPESGIPAMRSAPRSEIHGFMSLMQSIFRQLPSVN